MEVSAPRTRLLFSGLRIAATGLSAQRRRLEVVAENMANIESFNADGTPYRRKIVQLMALAESETVEVSSAAPGSGDADAPEEPDGFQGVLAVASAASGRGVEILGIIEDLSEGARVYDPGHAFADEDGYVTMPNVTITTEFADMMNAQRLYEANASVFRAIKNMLNKAIQL